MDLEGKIKKTHVQHARKRNYKTDGNSLKLSAHRKERSNLDDEEIIDFMYNIHRLLVEKGAAEATLQGLRFVSLLTNIGRDADPNFRTNA